LSRAARDGGGEGRRPGGSVRRPVKRVAATNRTRARRIYARIGLERRRRPVLVWTTSPLCTQRACLLLLLLLYVYGLSSARRARAKRRRKQ